MSRISMESAFRLQRKYVHLLVHGICTSLYNTLYSTTRSPVQPKKLPNNTAPSTQSEGHCHHTFHSLTVHPAKRQKTAWIIVVNDDQSLNISWNYDSSLIVKLWLIQIGRYSSQQVPLKAEKINYEWLMVAISLNTCHYTVFIIDSSLSTSHAA